MNQLDELTRRALCAGDQPPPGVEDRIFAAIVGPLGGPGPDGGGGGGSTLAPGSGAAAASGPTSLAYAAKVVAATLGLAAGGVALVAVSAAGIRSVRDAPPRDSIAQVEAAPAKSASAVAVAQPHVEPAPAAPLAPELGSEAGEPVPQPPQPVSSPKPAKLAVESPAPESGIEAELALMQLARASTQPKAALTALEQHRSRFPHGVFAAEREVLRVETLCALGRAAEAEAVAAAFIARDPSNPLRSRVEPACDTPN